MFETIEEAEARRNVVMADHDRLIRIFSDAKASMPGHKYMEWKETTGRHYGFQLTRINQELGQIKQFLHEKRPPVETPPAMEVIDALLDVIQEEIRNHGISLSSSGRRSVALAKAFKSQFFSSITIKE